MSDLSTNVYRSVPKSKTNFFSKNCSCERRNTSGVPAIGTATAFQGFGVMGTEEETDDEINGFLADPHKV